MSDNTTPGRRPPPAADATEQDRERAERFIYATAFLWTAGDLNPIEEVAAKLSAEARAAEFERCRAFVAKEHHGQKADDRCIEDDDRLYAFFGLPPCDRRVGDKAEMLANCARFIDRRCEGGSWPTYAELEADRDRLRAALEMLAQCRHVSGSAQGAFRTNLRITDAVLAGADVRDVDTVEAIVNGEWKPTENQS